MKERMGFSTGKTQGDMSPKVSDYQKPEKSYPERGFSKTDEYIERQDKFQGKEAAGIRKQGYMGRYS